MCFLRYYSCGPIIFECSTNQSYGILGESPKLIIIENNHGEILTSISQFKSCEFDTKQISAARKQVPGRRIPREHKLQTLPKNT